MVKQFLLKQIQQPTIAGLLIKPTLGLHNLSYKLASLLAIEVEGGIHPKHRIMKYKEWFLNNIAEQDVVVDVGCNTGMMVEAMSGKADFVYGVEIDQGHYEEAVQKRQLCNNQFICADATCYDFSKCLPVDCVTMSNVLEHIHDRVGFLQKLVKQIAWKNRESKKLLIRVPMIDREWLAVYKKEMGVEYRLDPTHYTEYTFEQFENELDSANVKVVSHYIRFGEIYAVCKA